MKYGLSREAPAAAVTQTQFRPLLEKVSVDARVRAVEIEHTYRELVQVLRGF